MSKISIIAIVAMDESRVIGFQNKLPWHLPEDFKRFSKLTTGHTVLMGRNTYWSLPEKYRPLPNRQNVVISSTMKNELRVTIEKSPVDFIKKIKQGEVAIQGDKLWVIGGEQIYKATQALWDMIELTLVKGQHQGDTYFPEFEKDFKLLEKQELSNCSFLTYRRIANT